VPVFAAFVMAEPAAANILMFSDFPSGIASCHAASRSGNICPPVKKSLHR
jgi:hypothetical protein